jgi:hypothetical protein
MRRGDLVIDDVGGHTTIGMVLAAGPRAIDVIEECGGTTRYKRTACPFRIPSAAELRSVFQGDAAYEARTRERLAAEVDAARGERRRGEGIYRGHVWRR